VFILDMRTYKDPNSNDLPLGLVVGDGPGTYEGVGQGDNGAAGHHYDPARAAVGDFTPFWEFVSGPANAGAFGPNPLDGTFGRSGRGRCRPSLPGSGKVRGVRRVVSSVRSAW
jgi:alkaline phosphatase D